MLSPDPYYTQRRSPGAEQTRPGVVRTGDRPDRGHSGNKPRLRAAVVRRQRGSQRCHDGPMSPLRTCPAWRRNSRAPVRGDNRPAQANSDSARSKGAGASHRLSGDAGRDPAARNTRNAVKPWRVAATTTRRHTTVCRPEHGDSSQLSRTVAASRRYDQALLMRRRQRAVMTIAAAYRLKYRDS